MAADNSALQELHEFLAAELLDIVRNGVPCKWDDNGAVIAHRKASAAELGCAITFLKNNSITAALEDSDDAQKLLAELQARAKKKSKPILHDMLSDIGQAH